MIPKFTGRSAVLLLIVATGCGVVGPRRDTVTRGPKNKSPEIAMGGKSTREPPLADPSSMIPPKPNMDDLVPAIPASPGKEEIAITPLPEKTGVVPASGIVTPDGLTTRPPLERARAVAEEPIKTAAATEPIVESNLDAVRRIAKRATERYNQMEGFECRLTRREMVGKQAMPQEELQYRFRREPYSLHIKWIGLEAQGRELVYVAGKYDGKVQIMTGKGDSMIVGAGYKVSRLPTDKEVRGKARYDIREGGMGLSIQWLGKVVGVMERDPSQAKRMKYLGIVKGRPECPSGLEAVEELIPPDWEPLLPKGGKRTTYFDPDPASPSYGLPILVAAFNDAGREVEYYFFDHLHPTRPADADFDIERLWRK
ncbi:MAG TPA: DUF1571 domain-containing protein [Gemmataceae bacterium]|jgi:hypothetical protein|nr:DUF1571 domain-containing protein [Gemmataceae bacterium]